MPCSIISIRTKRIYITHISKILIRWQDSISSTTGQKGICRRKLIVCELIKEDFIWNKNKRCRPKSYLRGLRILEDQLE